MRPFQIIMIVAVVAVYSRMVFRSKKWLSVKFKLLLLCLAFIFALFSQQIRLGNVLFDGAGIIALLSGIEAVDALHECIQDKGNEK